jgi:hypothetical protein
MGKLTGGILGPIKGKVGAIVGAVVGGQNVVKSMPASYADKKSDSQLTQRSTFANTLIWFQALSGVVNEGFVEKQAKHSSYNAFMSENVGIGVITAVPVWNALKVSKGSLVAPDIAMNTTALETTLEFNWSDDSDGSNKLATDKIFCVVINPATKEVFMSDGKDTRADESITVDLPASMQGIPVQTYCFAKKADGKKASNSKRTGLGTSGTNLAGSVQ